MTGIFKNHPWILALAFLLAACANGGVGKDIDAGLADANTDIVDAMQDVDAAFEQGYSTDGPLSPEEREHVRRMALYCHTSEANIRGLRSRGLAWSAIAQKYGVYDLPAVRRACRAW